MKKELGWNHNKRHKHFYYVISKVLKNIVYDNKGDTQLKGFGKRVTR